MIKGILFDFDGTLSYRAASAYQMYRYLLSLLLNLMERNILLEVSAMEKLFLKNVVITVLDMIRFFMFQH